MNTGAGVLDLLRSCPVLPARPAGGRAPARRRCRAALPWCTGRPGCRSGRRSRRCRCRAGRRETFRRRAGVVVEAAGDRRRRCCSRSRRHAGGRHARRPVRRSLATPACAVSLPATSASSSREDLRRSCRRARPAAARCRPARRSCRPAAIISSATFSRPILASLSSARRMAVELVGQAELLRAGR